MPCVVPRLPRCELYRSASSSVLAGWRHVVPAVHAAESSALALAQREFIAGSTPSQRPLRWRAVVGCAEHVDCKQEGVSQISVAVDALISQVTLTLPGGGPTLHSLGSGQKKGCSLCVVVMSLHGLHIVRLHGSAFACVS